MGDVDAGTKFEVERSTQSGVYFLSMRRGRRPRAEGGSQFFEPGVPRAVSPSSLCFQASNRLHGRKGTSEVAPLELQAMLAGDAPIHIEPAFHTFLFCLRRSFA